MKLYPLGDRILAKLDPREEKSKGGIHFPEQTQERPMFATIVAVGDGRLDETGKLKPLRVKEGDRIMFGKYAGTEIMIDNVGYCILREDDILGVVAGK